MNRRGFLVSMGTVAAFTSIPFMHRIFPSRPLVINDAYSLWYNRPAVAETHIGFCLGYITTGGEIRIAEIDEQLLVRKVVTIHKFQSPSDHGSPTLVRIPSGKYRGHILACYSNHSSPLFCARSEYADHVGDWGEPKVVDPGRATYSSMIALPDGKIVLMHTLQERVGRYDAGEWRRVVTRFTLDGGATWSEPSTIAQFGAGTFPYSTALSSNSLGHCAMAYTIYTSVQKKHRGLCLVLTVDAFETKVEIPIDLGDALVLDTIPYETKWISDTLVAVTYTQMNESGKEALNRVVIIDVNKRDIISDLAVSFSAIHSYAGGATIDSSGQSIISSPPLGGLVRQNLTTGATSKLIQTGSFSSPWYFEIKSKPLLMALSNPSIISTRRFSSEILILPI